MGTGDDIHHPLKRMIVLKINNKLSQPQQCIKTKPVDDRILPQIISEDEEISSDVLGGDDQVLPQEFP